jgi:hypothetical protein
MYLNGGEITFAVLPLEGIEVVLSCSSVLLAYFWIGYGDVDLVVGMTTYAFYCCIVFKLQDYLPNDQKGYFEDRLNFNKQSVRILRCK